MLQAFKRLKKTLIMNLQPFIKSAFNYMPPSDALEGFNEKRDIFCNNLCFFYMNTHINANSIRQKKVFRQ